MELLNVISESHIIHENCFQVNLIGPLNSTKNVYRKEWSALHFRCLNFCQLILVNQTYSLKQCIHRQGCQIGESECS